MMKLSTATLSGAPDTPGDHAVVLQVADERGTTAMQAFTITVSDAPAMTGIMQGSVVDEQVNPIEGATVTLCNERGQMSVALLIEELTDSEGLYRFDNV